MITRMLKRVPARSDRWCTTMRRNLREAIERAAPNGVVDVPFDPGEVILAAARKVAEVQALVATLNRLDGSAIRVARRVVF